jgi:hypothetical protein
MVLLKVQGAKRYLKKAGALQTAQDFDNPVEAVPI